jgi:hypothetical protein
MVRLDPAAMAKWGAAIAASPMLMLLPAAALKLTDALLYMRILPTVSDAGRSVMIADALNVRISSVAGAVLCGDQLEAVVQEPEEMSQVYVCWAVDTNGVAIKHSSRCFFIYSFWCVIKNGTHRHWSFRLVNES